MDSHDDDFGIAEKQLIDIDTLKSLRLIDPSGSAAKREMQRIMDEVPPTDVRVTVMVPKELYQRAVASGVSLTKLVVKSMQRTIDDLEEVNDG